MVVGGVSATLSIRFVEAGTWAGRVFINPAVRFSLRSLSLKGERAHSFSRNLEARIPFVSRVLLQTSARNPLDGGFHV